MVYYGCIDRVSTRFAQQTGLLEMKSDVLVVLIGEGGLKIQFVSRSIVSLSVNDVFRTVPVLNNTDDD